MGVPTFARRRATGVHQYMNELPDSITLSAIRSMAGNGMHMAAVGCLIMILLAEIQTASTAAAHVAE